MLIVDDNVAAGHALSESLTHEGYSCELAPTGSMALSIVDRTPYDIVICDVRVAGMSDMELLDRLRRIDTTLPVIVLTATRTIPEAVDATKRGAFQYLAKSGDSNELRGVVVQATGERAPA